MNGSKIAGVLFITSWMSIAAAASSGVIHFTGKLCESGCETRQTESRVLVSCYRNGKTLQAPVSLRSKASLPANIGHTEVTWLDDEHRQGVVLLTYR